MKRSEMIELVWDKIQPDTDKYLLKDNIANLVSLFEELGMQPPAIKEPCETFVLHNGQYLKTEDSFIFTHKWDEEDGK